jgi:site-specific recombinase XerC
LRTDDIADLIAKLEERGYEGSSIHAYLVPLNLICARAVRRGLLAANPVSGLEKDEKPKVGDTARRVLDSTEIPLLIDATPERYRLLG